MKTNEEQHLVEYEAELEAYAKYSQRKALQTLWAKRLKDCSEVSGRLARWWYVAKGTACLLLGLSRMPEPRWRNTVSECAVWDVASHNHPGVPSQAAGWTELSIGRGVFRNWGYSIYENTSY